MILENQKSRIQSSRMNEDRSETSGTAEKSFQNYSDGEETERKKKKKKHEEKKGRTKIHIKWSRREYLTKGEKKEAVAIT